MTVRLFGITAALALAAVLAGCSRSADAPPESRAANALTVTSTAFRDGEAIPREFTCDGANVSPPLSWVGVPPAAKSAVLVCDDPDAPAGTWTHWVAFNLPPSVTSLPRGAGTGKLPDGAPEARNDFGEIGYGGPCPPDGTHTYRFTVYALDRTIALPSGSSHREVLDAVEGHVLAQGVLTGTYTKR